MLPKFSIGVGDRFAQQGQAQLRACLQAAAHGVVVAPVWNKSNREHNLIGSQPAETRAEADEAVRALGWEHPYFVDADHIGLKTVDRFVPHADFFTIDVADFIGQTPDPVKLGEFIGRHPELAGPVALPGVSEPLNLTAAGLRSCGEKYLVAIEAAGAICRHILTEKARTAKPGNRCHTAVAPGGGVPQPASPVVIEVSMDETSTAQTPGELLAILAGLADEGVPLNTIAPKFTGQFYKGVDYIGDPGSFEREFRADVAALRFAVGEYGLPADLKLSVHSGSDKFSLYPIMRRAVTELGAGLHLKTAGTTWLEELAGLAQAGGESLDLARRIYGGALARIEELIAPYATVVEIRRPRLPSLVEVEHWDGQRFASALRHDTANPHFNPDFRQLLHVAFRLAAEAGAEFRAALERDREQIGRGVTENLFQRHIRPLFLGPGRAEGPEDN